MLATYVCICRLQDHDMTAQDAYQYFVLRAQQIAISKNWTPVNWYVLILYLIFVTGMSNVQIFFGNGLNRRLCLNIVFKIGFK